MDDEAPPSSDLAVGIMVLSGFDRRRSEQLAQFVEEDSGGRRHAGSLRDEDLVEIVHVGRGISNLFDRRRAERFAQLMDEASGGRRHHKRSLLDEEFAKIAQLGRLGPEILIERSDDFRRDLRAQLLATVVREGIGSVSHTKRLKKRIRRLAEEVGIAEPREPLWSRVLGAVGVQPLRRPDRADVRATLEADIDQLLSRIGPPPMWDSSVKASGETDG